MRKMIFAVLILAVASSASAYTLLFPGGPILSRTINWSYDNSCSPSVLPYVERAARILDFVLDGVTINYLGVDSTGFNYTDQKSTVSCHNQTWFADGSGTLHKVSEANSGAFVDHSVSAFGDRLFDMAFHTAYIGSSPSIFEASLHEFTHVLGLNHSSDYWSVVHGNPFGAPNPYHYGWSEYLSNDDLVGLATYHSQPANCTPYLSATNKLYLPFIPVSGSPNPSVNASGFTAVFQKSGSTLTLLGTIASTHSYKYFCAVHNTGTGTIVGTGLNSAGTGLFSFTMMNNDPTGVNKSSWTYFPF